MIKLAALLLLCVSTSTSEVPFNAYQLKSPVAVIGVRG